MPSLNDPITKDTLVATLQTDGRYLGYIFLYNKDALLPISFTVGDGEPRLDYVWSLPSYIDNTYNDRKDTYIQIELLLSKFYRYYIKGKE